MIKAENMTRAQKAAAILVAMGKPAAGRLLKFFKQEELKALIEAARELRTIPQSELDRIVAEFEAEFAEGAGLLDSADKMDTILNETLSPEEVSVLMGGKKPAADEGGPPSVWPEVERLEPAVLAEFLSVEHPQTGAVVLSRLSSEAAAAVMVALDKDLRRRIIARMVALSEIPEAASRLIESQIRRRLLSGTRSRDTAAGRGRLVNVLNELDKAQLDEVMEDLAQAGSQEDLAAIRARLFSFEDVPLLDQKARVALFDGLPTELLTLALRGVSAEIGEAVLSAIGARSRRMIESELELDANVPAADIARARRMIVSTAIRLSGEGTIELPGAQDAEAA